MLLDDEDDEERDGMVGDEGPSCNGGQLIADLRAISSLAEQNRRSIGAVCRGLQNHATCIVIDVPRRKSVQGAGDGERAKSSGLFLDASDTARSQFPVLTLILSVPHILETLCCY